jgi:hypothetical protein
MCSLPTNGPPKPPSPQFIGGSSSGLAEDRGGVRLPWSVEHQCATCEPRRVTGVSSSGRAAVTLMLPAAIRRAV